MMGNNDIKDSLDWLYVFDKRWQEINQLEESNDNDTINITKNIKRELAKKLRDAIDKIEDDSENQVEIEYLHALDKIRLVLARLQYENGIEGIKEMNGQLDVIIKDRTDGQLDSIAKNSLYHILDESYEKVNSKLRRILISKDTIDYGDAEELKVYANTNPFFANRQYISEIIHSSGFISDTTFGDTFNHILTTLTVLNDLSILPQDKIYFVETHDDINEILSITISNAKKIIMETNERLIDTIQRSYDGENSSNFSDDVLKTIEMNLTYLNNMNVLDAIKSDKTDETLVSWYKLLDEIGFNKVVSTLDLLHILSPYRYGIIHRYISNRCYFAEKQQEFIRNYLAKNSQSFYRRLVKETIGDIK